MKKFFTQHTSYYLGSMAIFILITFLSCTKLSAPKNVIEIPTPGSGGDSIIVPPVNPPERIKDTLTMDKFIGANGFHEDKTEWMAAVGTIRAYCNWDWFQGDNPNDPFIFQNSRGGWYFDDAFQKMKDAKIATVICFQGAIKNLQGKGNFKFNDKPIDAPGLNTLDPNSYKAISNALFQLAARYGKTKVNDALLNVPTNQKKSGMNLINYLEVWNEPDKDWEGKDAQFSPEEYAAMLSICYDRIKEADPTMKVAMAGLATLSVDYVKRMNEWFKTNRRDKKFAADVVNVHVYAYNNKIVWGKTWPLIGPAETPEAGRLKEKSQELVDYCKTAIPGAEVWISEFGWDTNAQSVLSPKPVTGITLLESQGRFMVRAYMAFAAAGIDQAQMFILADPSQNYIDTHYGTSGLLDRTLNFSKKPSWYYTHTLKTALTNMVYIGEQGSGNPNILIYKFKKTNSSEGCYVAWFKTESNANDNAYKLILGPSAKSAKITELTVGEANGITRNLTINNESVTISVSEKPVIITVDNITK